MQPRYPNVMGLLVAVFVIGSACVGCVPQERFAARAPDQSAASLSLQMPSLGDPVFPHEVPYPESAPSRSAYLQGFATGWQIIQDAGRGSLVVVPQKYAESAEAQAAWKNGIRDGKKSAYRVYQRQSPDPSPDKDHDDGVIRGHRGRGP